MAATVTIIGTASRFRLPPAYDRLVDMVIERLRGRGSFAARGVPLYGA